ncbi:ATP-binding protein [Dactylosporangium sp. CA-092794]|uniref:ATP-binding protein n=1 Tax=Dactylosporangium sp. CA-092794 TaxID=3239929 RepID=UPI003D8EAE70
MTDPRGLRWNRLRTLPRPPDGTTPDPLPPQVYAALLAAHAAGPIGVAWLRPPGTAELTVLVGGTGAYATMYPPGGTCTDAGPVGEHLWRFGHWVGCAGQMVLPEREAVADPAVHPEPRRLENFVAALPDPFAWLVVATPVVAAALAEQRRQLARRLPALGQAVHSEADRLAAELDRLRHRELTRTDAIWQVSVLAGGTTPIGARTAAALLCGASDLDAVPYELTPRAEVVDLAAAVDAPFLASTALVAALARPPRRELPGLRLTSPARFDVTPEPTPSGPTVNLGEVLDAVDRPAGSFPVSFDTLNRHAFVCGATGSGKSQTVRSLLESVSRLDTPLSWLVIESAKAEYARIAGRLGPALPIVVLRPGDLDAPPVCLNPLEPEPGYPLQSHVDLVRALFLAAFAGHEPFPQVLSRSLTECYRAGGWDLVTGDPVPAVKPKYRLDDPDEPASRRYPTLGDLQTVARRIVERIGYGPEMTADVRGFIDVRLGSLREGTPGRFFEGGHPLDIGALLRLRAILELDTITNDQDKAFLIGMVLIRIVEHLRVHHGSQGAIALHHLIVIEEAHRLLRKVDHGPQAAAVELFATLLAEIRAYGEGVVVVEQIPSKLVPDVIKNSALKIAHRLPAADDRSLVGGTMNLQDDQSEALVAFRPGEAAVTVDGADRPLKIRIPLGESREHAAVTPAHLPIGRRCPGCTAAPCTLAQLNTARRLAEQPLLVVWIEALTMAFVAGEPRLFPNPDLAPLVNSVGPETLRCAVRHAAERSVLARADVIRRYVDVDDYIEAVHAAANALLTGQRRDVDPRFRAGVYRWNDVLDQLRTRSEALGDDATALPASADWAARGLSIPGPTTADQIAQLRLRPDAGPAVNGVALGDPDASGLRAAVLALRGQWGGEPLQAALRYACHPLLADLAVQFVQSLIDNEVIPQ